MATTPVTEQPDSPGRAAECLAVAAVALREGADEASPGAAGARPEADSTPAPPLLISDELAEILADIAALAAGRPQEDFDDDDVFDAGVGALNALGEKITIAARRRRLLS